MKLLSLLTFILIFSSINGYSQVEDNFYFMGMDRDEILNSKLQKNERIYSGNYNELAYAMDDETAYWFYFDENNECFMFIIKKNVSFFETALLILGSDFPKRKKGGEINFFWNSRMMAALISHEDYIDIVYQKVLPELLKQ